MHIKASNSVRKEASLVIVGRNQTFYFENGQSPDRSRRFSHPQVARISRKIPYTDSSKFGQAAFEPVPIRTGYKQNDGSKVVSEQTTVQLQENEKSFRRKNAKWPELADGQTTRLLPVHLASAAMLKRSWRFSTAKLFFGFSPDSEGE